MVHAEVATSTIPISAIADHGSPARTRSLGLAYGVFGLWLLELVLAAISGPTLEEAWPAWLTGFAAISVWGLNLLVLYYGVGPPFTLSRVPMLSALFGFVMSVVGSANYWATTYRFPVYRVFIERAALFVAICTFLSLVGCLLVLRYSRSTRSTGSARLFVWDWGRLRLLSYAMLAVCLIGTYMTVQRIGFIPILAGDPESLRLTFPEIAGIWLRLSTQVGIVLAVIVGAQICARRASGTVWVAGVLGMLCASLYGNRFFAAMPIGAILLLWDRVRRRVPLSALVLGFVVGVPALALFGYWRYQEAPIDVLSPLMLVLFGTLMEFRDLAWTMEYYSGGHALLHGSTVGSMFMPLLPSPIWSALGIDKAAVYAHSNAVVLGQEMWQSTPQRIGIYGELFMNFGWIGALIGALIYGALIGYVDRQFQGLRDRDAVRGIMLAVVCVALVYAQMGQWDMDVTAVTSTCYPILLLGLVAARRRSLATAAPNPGHVS